MPMRYSIEKQRNLVVSTISGTLTYAEAKAHQDQLLEDPEFDPAFHQLMESLQADSIELTSDEIRTLATRAVFSTASKRAFVAVNPAFFGIARMMQSYHELSPGASQIQVFRTMAEACRWLEE